MRDTFRKRAFDYLIKPFSTSRLRETLRDAAEHYGLTRSSTPRFRHAIGRRIRILRRDRDWTLNDMAEASKLSVSLISSIERGIHLPSLESLLTIAKAFGLRPSELLESIDF
jgi:ribosome-binding protein aMBF1 (putative translation factor)